MLLDLTRLYQDIEESISINGEYIIPKEYYENSDVISLDPVVVTGEVTKDEEEGEHITCNVKGNMVLLDSISNEEVNYPFQFSYDDALEENCKKDEKNLDIFLFLWENIVLEVPLQFTKVSDLSKFHGDGWRLISEDEYRYQSNPFSELLKDYDKE